MLVSWSYLLIKLVDSDFLQVPMNTLDGQPSTAVAQDMGDGKEDVVPIRATNVELTGGVSVLPCYAALEISSFDLMFAHFKRSRCFMLVMCHFRGAIYLIQYIYNNVV